MPYNDSDLMAANRAQFSSEVDDFTEERYAQFFRHLPPDAASVLDVGCNTGRGGAVLKRMAPGLHLDGLDCVPERLDAVQEQIYGGFALLPTQSTQKHAPMTRLLQENFSSMCRRNRSIRPCANFSVY